MISHICIMIRANNVNYRKKKRLIFKTTERGKLRLLTLLSSHPFYSNSDLSLLQVNKCLGILDGEKSSRKQDKDKLMNL